MVHTIRTDQKHGSDLSEGGVCYTRATDGGEISRSQGSGAINMNVSKNNHDLGR